MNEVIIKTNLKSIKHKTKMENILNNSIKTFFPCSVVENRLNSYLVHSVGTYIPISKINELNANNLIRLFRFIISNIEICCDYLLNNNEYEINENNIYACFNKDNIIVDVKFIYIPKSKNNISYRKCILYILYSLRTKARDNHSISVIDNLIEKLSKSNYTYLSLMALLEDESNDSQLRNSIRY